jgi:hypothetical protein
VMACRPRSPTKGFGRHPHHPAVCSATDQIPMSAMCCQVRPFEQ